MDRGPNDAIFCRGMCIAEPQENVWDSGHQKAERKESIVGNFLGASETMLRWQPSKSPTQEAPSPKNPLFLHLHHFLFPQNGLFGNSFRIFP